MKRKNPRHGSMQFWPRKKAKRQYPRVNCFPKSNEAKMIGFAGYKVGMTHILTQESTKGPKKTTFDVSIPVTVIECPPLKVASIRFYKYTEDGPKVISEIFAPKLDKELGRKIALPKKSKNKIEDIKEFDEIRLNIYTQPKLTGIGKKKPELFEAAVGGKKEEQLNYAKEILGKEISAKDILSEGQQLDIHSVTKGKGYQGPVKRFGVSLRAKKSEKTKRGPGSICGGWKAQAHMMYRVAFAGQTGYHTRTEWNKQVIKIIEDPKEVTPKGDFLQYGKPKNTCVLLKGSVGGSRKRLIRLIPASRPNKTIKGAPKINYISLSSKQ